jgi:hypothetical protein
MLKKSWGYKVRALGIILFLIGFYYEGILAGLPFQDPELVPKPVIDKYYDHISTGQTFYTIGLSIFLIGTLMSIGKAIYFRMNKKRPDS